jgi:hypothetical protein
MEVVEFELSEEQIALVAPILRAHADERCNTMFIATAAPNLGAWRFQAISLPISHAQIVLKIINKELTPKKKANDNGESQSSKIEKETIDRSSARD